MSLTAGPVWGHTPRPWGYEVRVDFTDDATGQIYNEVLTFPAEPTKSALDAQIASRLERVTAMAYPPPPPRERRSLS